MARPAPSPPLPDVFEGPEELAAFLSYCRNDLEAPAVRLEPRIGEVLETLRGEPETLLGRMSGSGATCFGLFGTAAAARAAMAALPAAWWSAAGPLYEAPPG